MANRIQIKRSLTSGNVPNATDLLVGEFAVNIPDKKIFTKDGAEQVVKLTVTDYSELTGTPTLGTAAAKDVPTTGDAATTEVVLGSDTRLADARTPLSHSHANATTTSSGFISADDQLKLNGIEAGANAYVHPTGDGNLHVPATGTTSAGKVLTAGADAGSLSWQTPSTIDSTKLPLSGGTMTGSITFAAGQTWPTFNQSTTGNAATATKLATARNINGVSFDGTANITINAVDSTAREPAITAGTTAQYFRGDKTWQTLNKTAVGLGSVDNTSDLDKPISTATQTALGGKSDSGHAHGAATTSAAGFMSAADKTKLDGVAAGANAYIHPENHPASIIMQDANNRFVTDAEKAAWNSKEAQPSDVSYTYDASGRVETTTETLPTGTRTTTVTYNEAGQVKTVAVTLGTSTRTTQYAYNQYGVLTGTTSTES